MASAVNSNNPTAWVGTVGIPWDSGRYQLDFIYFKQTAKEKITTV